MKKNNFLFFVGMLSIGLCANTPIFAQSKTTTFEQLTTAIKNISYASIDVADYDNDGDDDFVIEGAIDSNDDGYADKSILYVYKNNDGTYEEIGDANLYGLHLGSVKFIDIDNDGDYDIIASGQNYSDISVHYLSIYENNNGSFTKKQDLVGGIYTSTDCGDIDNDGDMDFIISGTGMVSGSLTKFFKIYENNNAVFTEITNTIVPNRAGCAKFGDIDTDGDLDIILMGLTDDSTSPKTMRTYKNANGTFSESQILSVGLCNGWFDLGDIDDDGDLDIVAMGLDNDINGKIIVYKNENSNFTADASINGISSSSSTNSLEFGDYDNDGDLDFISAGSDASYNSNTTLYKNTNGVFSSSEETFVQVGGGATLAWLDIDKDNDLDLFLSGFSTVSGSYATSTFMYKNNITATNAKPEKPTNLQYSATETKSTFSWDASTDDHTNSLALSYLLTVGTTEGKGDIMSYVVHGTSWSLKKIETETIYWSVQAIDASNVRSDKATDAVLEIKEIDGNDKLFSIKPNPCVNYIKINNNTTIENIELIDMQGKIVKQVKTTELNTVKIDVSDLNSGIYIAKITSGNNVVTRKFIKR